MRKVKGDLMERDLWTPTDLSWWLRCDYKTALSHVKSVRHVRVGRRYLVSRSLIFRQFGLDSHGEPMLTSGVPDVG